MNRKVDGRATEERLTALVVLLVPLPLLLLPLLPVPVN